MSFLKHTLAGSSTDALQNYLGSRATALAAGVIEVLPKQSSGQSIVLSSGIHGNETAPMELLDGLVDEIVKGKLEPRNPLLLIIGNPAAAREQQRFVEHNLNRLFSASASQTGSSKEHQRAIELQGLVERFYAKTSGSLSSAGSLSANKPLRLHYDLHTAIRRSKIEKFAVYPFLHQRSWSQSQLAFLEQCGIDAVLLSNQPAGTFSYFTSRHLQAHSFTVELGRVKPFGQNDLSKYLKLVESLRGLIEGHQRFESKPESLQVFKVVEEVIKRSDGLKLHIPDDAHNFSPYPAGTLLASDETYQYITQIDNERFVFPIQNVPIGQRAMLIVAPTKLGERAQT